MKRYMACLVALVLLLMPGMNALAATKNEIVYVTLNADGAIHDIYVVNRFDSDQVEQTIDYGEYYRVSNLSDTTELFQSLDGVRLTLPDGTFFYQGDPVSKTLPWRCSMEYQLDGLPIPADQLGGRSGALTMQLDIEQGSERYQAFFDHYLLSITITLDGDLCKNIKAEKATIANVGKDKMLTYTLLPGTAEHYLITADVANFELGDIQINAVPMGMELGDVDTGEIMDKIDQLQSGIQQIDSGAAKLASGANALAEGTGELVTNSVAFSAGLDEVKQGTGELAKASASMIELLDSVAGADGNEGLSVGDLKKICKALSDGLGALEDAIGAITGQAQALSNDADALQKQADALSSSSGSMFTAQGDIDTLRTLLNRASDHADVSSYLSGEIAALRRVLNTVTAVNSGLGDLQQQASKVSAEAKALSGQISALATVAQPSLTAIRTALNQLIALVDQLEEGAGGTDEDSLVALAKQLNASVQALDQGVGQLQTGYAQLHLGMVAVDEGAQALSGGVGSLESGAGTLSSSTGDMDQQVTDGVDAAMESITGGDFDVVSYMDERNEVQTVQFAMKLKGVEIAEAEEQVQQTMDEEQLTFMQRLQALFE